MPGETLVMSAPAAVPTPVLTPSATPQARPAQNGKVDPYALVGPELTHVRDSLLRLLGSSHPLMNEIAKYYFLQPSKQLRPLLVLLFARVCNGMGTDWRVKCWQADCEGAQGRADEIDKSISRSDVLNDYNPSMPDQTASFQTTFSMIPPRRPEPPPIPAPQPGEHTPAVVDQILPTQIRLAQISEMLHVASLYHDDVVDESPLRRSAPSAPAKFGNKLAVFAGDVLLSRATAGLSRLGDLEVVELMTTVTANLVSGELLQMTDVHGPASRPRPEDWAYYLQKCYLKTASLMAKAVRASVILGGVREGEIWKEAAYAYGRNIGIAFQIVDDVLDYEQGEAMLGKPAGADLKLGLTTAPALYAWEEHEEMGELIKRRFKREGDIERVLELVRTSGAIQRTYDLARSYTDKALEALSFFPESEAKAALVTLTERVVQRKS